MIYIYSIRPNRYYSCRNARPHRRSGIASCHAPLEIPSNTAFFLVNTLYIIGAHRSAMALHITTTRRVCSNTARTAWLLYWRDKTGVMQTKFTGPILTSRIYQVQLLARWNSYRDDVHSSWRLVVYNKSTRRSNFSLRTPSYHVKTTDDRHTQQN